MNPQSESNYRGTGCGKAARPGLKGSGEATNRSTWNYVDPERRINWRKWMWIVPEGTNILPDGRWHRINDLSNGANQGPVMHALEACAGVDDTDPGSLKIMPRIPDPLNGIEISNHFALLPGEVGLTKARLSYQFEKYHAFSMKSDIPIPDLSIRLDPTLIRKSVTRLRNKLQTRE